MDGNVQELNDYCVENLGMELMDTRIVSVKEEIEAWEKAINSEEFKNDDHSGDLEIIEELKKFEEYDCMYSIDAERGGCFGQAYIILNKDLKYIDLVRTI